MVLLPGEEPQPLGRVPKKLGFGGCPIWIRFFDEFFLVEVGDGFPEANF